MYNNFKTISSKELFHNPYWDYYLDKYSINNKEFDYHYVRSRGSVIIIPQMIDGNFLMINQYRYLNKRSSIEFPGGGLEPDMSYEKAAIKELAEETGYSCKKLEYVGEFNPFNGVTDEICRVFLASELEKVNASSDETEKIQVMYCSLDEINQLIKSNKIWDGMSISSLYIYLSKYKNLL